MSSARGIRLGPARQAISGASWSPMRTVVTRWGHFPSQDPLPSINFPLGRCSQGVPLPKLQPLQDPRPTRSEARSVRDPVSAWREARQHRVVVALVTLFSGFGVMMLALFAWGGRSELDAALLPVPAPSPWISAWSDFKHDSSGRWHSLPVQIQLAKTAFSPLPGDWQRHGQANDLVWVYQESAADGFLARFVNEDGQRLKSLLAKGGALKLVVQAKRLSNSRLMEIARVKKLGWGRGQKVFAVGHRTLAPTDAVSAEAWLGKGAESSQWTSLPSGEDF